VSTESVTVVVPVEDADMPVNQAEPAARAGGYAWFVVVLLTLANMLSFLDRQILNLMVGPIRQDLGIGDTEMSLLMGFSFAIFYTVCGIPLAWCADRYSRKWLIVGGAAAWSIATAACGLAGRYGHMVVARIGVGVGEASLSPASYSLITDYFPKQQRVTAMSVFAMGNYIGAGLAFLIGGYVIHWAQSYGPVVLPVFGEVRSWQLVFLTLGLFGVIFSFALMLIRDPERGPGHSRQPVSATWTKLRSHGGTLLYHHFGFSLIALAGYGSSAWLPSYFIRTQGWTEAQTGLIYGSAVAIFGIIGIFAGGRLADWLVARGYSDGTLRVGVLAALLAVPVMPLVMVVDGFLPTFIALAVAVFFFSMPTGCAAAALQEIMPSNMRAQATAVYLFVFNMIGLGLGPTAVAVVTDFVFADDMAVGHSLVWVCSSALLLGSVLLYLGLAPYRRSYSQCRAELAMP